MCREQGNEKQEDEEGGHAQEQLEDVGQAVNPVGEDSQEQSAPPEEGAQEQASPEEPEQPGQPEEAEQNDGPEKPEGPEQPEKPEKGGLLGHFDFRRHPKATRTALIATVVAIVLMVVAMLVPVSAPELTKKATLGGASVMLPEGMETEKKKDDFGVSHIIESNDAVQVILVRQVVDEDDDVVELTNKALADEKLSSQGAKAAGDDDASVTIQQSDLPGSVGRAKAYGARRGNLFSLVVIEQKGTGRSAAAAFDAIDDTYKVSTDSITVTVEDDGEKVTSIKAEAAAEGAIVRLPDGLTRDHAILDGWKVESDGGADSRPRVIDVHGAYYLVQATEDTTVSVLWVPAWTVTFMDGNGNVLGTDTVMNMRSATPPVTPTREDAEFTGWDADFSRVKADMTVNATWTPIWTVTFTDGSGNVLSTQKVINGQAATAPAQPSRGSDYFGGWDADFSSVTSDMTVNAVWVTLSQRNALAKAKDYLAFTAFSYSGLVDQLEFEGYSHDDAVWAVDRCGADWNEQAALKAADYLDFMSFSRAGLIDQLEFEGFTYDQAVYGVNAVGL